ncbi:hypothetical protein F4820DRAFT_447303 [Hypoxylon rubiginosum]|uniref:Uncharacterized protein n=1 Tax=Hypoxylon rubiginosum TaxID=110542 RepID=A0ACB9Z3R9_9PEZI|nr:hypothetical protein F4820DRAFT_447303 [Hypoxylon rubiginosum]
MKFSAVFALVLASIASAAPVADEVIDKTVDRRGGDGNYCLNYCAPVAPQWDAYAACLAACHAAGVEGDSPVDPAAIA